MTLTGGGGGWGGGEERKLNIESGSMEHGGGNREQGGGEQGPPPYIGQVYYWHISHNLVIYWSCVNITSNMYLMSYTYRMNIINTYRYIKGDPLHVNHIDSYSSVQKVVEEGCFDGTEWVTPNPATCPCIQDSINIHIYTDTLLLNNSIMPMWFCCY